MFPWSPEFKLDAGHVAFFAALYGVLLVVGASLLRAWVLARRQLGHADALAWQEDFHGLPAVARACRHQLSGECPDRSCERGFDCRGCDTHQRLIEQRASVQPASVSHAGLALPQDRFYHRGHTWLRPEEDGTVTVGVDDLGRRLLGTPDRVDLPQPGAQLKVNGTAARIRTGGSEVRLLSPVEGEVIEARADTLELRIKPRGEIDTRHLLTPTEAGTWLLRELERLEQSLGGRELGATLADGGELVPDLAKVLPRRQYDAALGAMFLEA